MEIVTIRLRARGLAEKPDFPEQPVQSGPPAADALIRRQPVLFEGKAIDTPAYRREKLGPGQSVPGPALLVIPSGLWGMCALVEPRGPVVEDLFGIPQFADWANQVADVMLYE